MFTSASSRCGLIRCAECGSTITADKKTKFQKNGNIHHYIYYFWTRKKNPSCSQRHAAREEELEKQIIEILDSIQIPPEFHEWAINQLKEESKKEIEDRNKILASQHKACETIVRKIDRLIDMRINNEITEEEFGLKKANLIKEKLRLEELLKDTGCRVNQWLEKAEQVFTFAEKARDRFKNGLPEEKKAILQR